MMALSADGFNCEVLSQFLDLNSKNRNYLLKNEKFFVNSSPMKQDFTVEFQKSLNDFLQGEY